MLGQAAPQGRIEALRAIDRVVLGDAGVHIGETADHAQTVVTLPVMSNSTPLLRCSPMARLRLGGRPEIALRKTAAREVESERGDEALVEEFAKAGPGLRKLSAPPAPSRS